MPWPPLRDQPHYVLRLGRAGRDPIACLDGLETAVPGALVYAKSASTRNRCQRWPKLTPKARETLLADAVSFEVHVSLCGAWLATDILDDAGLSYDSVATPDCATIVPWSPADAGAYEARGRMLVAALETAGRLRPGVGEMLVAYQAVEVGFGSVRPWLFSRISPGGGKTVVALVLATAAKPRGNGIDRITTLVVGPAKCRSVWWRQSQRFTSLQPWRLTPSSETTAETETLEAFAARLDAEDATGIAIVGAESLPDHLEEVMGLKPQTLIFDEICSDAMAGRSGRWERVGDSDGSISFRPKLTAGGRASATERVSRSYAIMAVSRMPGILRRVALDGTPLYEGKPRRLFNPFDCLAPASFGFSSHPFKMRYAGARHNGFGFTDDGASNLDELRERASFFVHDVPYAASHGGLPKTRVEVVRLAPDELGPRARGEKAEIRDLTASIASGKAKNAALGELRLAHAAFRKHPRAIGDAMDTVKAGGKAVLFTARHRDCEALAAAATAAIAKLATGDAPVTARLWWAHGGTATEEARAKMVAEFHDRVGAAMLVGTGQAFGTSIDGLQVADFAGICMLTPRLGELSQWKGRFDRRDDREAAVATLVRIYLASGTVDDAIVSALGRQFPVIGSLFDIGDLGDLDEKLRGVDGASLEAAMDAIFEKLDSGGKP